MSLPFASVEEMRAAFNFSDLQSFLDLYYASVSVVCSEEDFYELTMAYLKKAASQNVKHAEIFFDPQTIRPGRSRWEPSSMESQRL